MDNCGSELKKFSCHVLPSYNQQQGCRCHQKEEANLCHCNQQANHLQQECGFDLLHYTGKKVDLVTYSITNYPTGEEVLADLLLYGDKLIGGAIYTTAVDGFMHGLRAVDK